MKFNPPVIENIKQVLPVIKDNPAFIVKDKGWYTVIDYLYMTDKLFHDPIERECRGIKFCSKTGRILARPYHKFHNLNERPDYKTENVSLTQPHVILDKIDGSMVHTCPTELGIYLMTRMGITQVAEAADKFLCANPVKYSRLFNMLPVDEYTFIFEYVGPNNKIVLDYAKEDLILTAIRHTVNGTYVFYDEMVELTDAASVPVVQHINPMMQTDISGLANHISKQTNTEGRVIRFDTGAMLKIKCDEYVRKHRTKDLVSSEKDMVRLIAENNLDDILPQLDEEVRKKVEDYGKQINKHINENAKIVTEFVFNTKDWTQKEFALRVQDIVPKPFQSVYFNARKTGLAREEVINLLLRNCSTNKRIGELLEALHFPRWTFSFFSEE